MSSYNSLVNNHEEAHLQINIILNPRLLLRIGQVHKSFEIFVPQKFPASYVASYINYMQLPIL